MVADQVLKCLSRQSQFQAALARPPPTEWVGFFAGRQIFLVASALAQEMEVNTVDANRLAELFAGEDVVMIVDGSIKILAADAIATRRQGKTVGTVAVFTDQHGDVKG